MRKTDGWKAAALAAVCCLALLGCAPLEATMEPDPVGQTSEEDRIDNDRFKASSSSLEGEDGEPASSQIPASEASGNSRLIEYGEERIEAEDLGHYWWCPLRKGIDERYDELFTLAVAQGQPIAEWEKLEVLERVDTAEDSYKSIAQCPDVFQFYKDEIELTQKYITIAADLVHCIELNLNDDGLTDYLVIWEGLPYSGNGRNGIRDIYCTFLYSTSGGYTECLAPGLVRGNIDSKAITVYNKKVNGFFVLSMETQGNVKLIDDEQWFFEEKFEGLYYYYFDPEGGYDGTGGFERFDPQVADKLPWE